MNLTSPAFELFVPGRYLVLVPGLIHLLLEVCLVGLLLPCGLPGALPRVDEGRHRFLVLDGPGLFDTFFASILHLRQESVCSPKKPTYSQKKKRSQIQVLQTFCNLD